MKANLAYIERFETRCSATDLRKLDYISSELGFRSNKSKAIRHLINEYAELLAWQSHQQEEVERQGCI